MQGRCELKIFGSENCSTGTSHLRSVPECPSLGCCKLGTQQASYDPPLLPRPGPWPPWQKPGKFPAVKLSPETQGLIAASLASEKFPMERITKLQKKKSSNVLLGQTHKHTETWPHTSPMARMLGDMGKESPVFPNLIFSETAASTAPWTGPVRRASQLCYQLVSGLTSLSLNFLQCKMDWLHPSQGCWWILNKWLFVEYIQHSPWNLARISCPLV